MTKEMARRGQRVKALADLIRAAGWLLKWECWVQVTDDPSRDEELRKYRRSLRAAIMDLGKASR